MICSTSALNLHYTDVRIYFWSATCDKVNRWTNTDRLLPDNFEMKLRIISIIPPVECNFSMHVIDLNHSSHAALPLFHSRSHYMIDTHHRLWVTRFTENNLDTHHDSVHFPWRIGMDGLLRGRKRQRGSVQKMYYVEKDWWIRPCL